jgi:polyhydroxyalkanoate synthase
MRVKQMVEPPGFERLASAWLGALTEDYPEHHYPSAQLDLLFNAWLARFTCDISPAALANAWFDWITHLQLSPSKQEKLVQKSWKKLVRWSAYATDPARLDRNDDCRCIEPLPQDRRFADPDWQQWPFNLISQAFLLNQQWWHRATTGVRGVSQHHEDVVTFVARQMLDMLAPSNFLLTNPTVLKETVRSGGMNLLRGAENAYADWAKSMHGKPPDSDDAFKVGESVAATPGKIVYRNRLIELIQYTPSTPSVHAVPVLFVPAWIMKYYILDLSPQNSLVKYLVDKGHTVFMISWKNPDASDRDLSLEDYRKLGVMAALDEVARITGAPQANAVGYCLGGTLLSIAAAAMARDDDMRLASMTLFASQADFKEPGELSLFIDESQISFLEAVMWNRGYLDTRQMAGAFQLLRSNDLIWSRRLNHYLLGLPEQQTDLMAWNADATRMPYRMHTEYLRSLFLHNDLAEGRYRCGDRAIILTDIEIPIFAVGTLTDHVAPWRSVFKIHLLTDTDVTFLLTSGGHNAGVVSPPGHPNRRYQMAERDRHGDFIDADSWQRDVPVREGSWWPAWETWLAARAGAPTQPPVIGTALCAAPGLYVLQQ